MLTRTFFSRAPLAPGRYAPLPAGAVTAKGALADRLMALRAGLLSRCVSLFPETGKDCSFYGGTLTGGVRAGDALDAMLLTSSQLGDEELRRQALSLAMSVTATQREDGFFGGENESFAARGRMLVALQTAYSMNGDKQLLTFMLRYMKYLQDSLSVSPLSPEDAMHISDTLQCGIALYSITGQKAILPVLQTLIRQGADSTTLLHAFPYKTPISRTLSAEALMQALEEEDDQGYYHRLMRTADGTNLAQSLRQSALSGVVTGSGKHLSAPEAGLARIMKAHGAANGAFTADPLVAGTHPSRGVSTTATCELATSLESLLACPDGEHLADALDTVMYNAVAATLAPDGRGVQSMQQANQVLLSRELRFPFIPDDANLFSCEDGDALCAILAAWPRFVQHQWMLTRDEGLCAMSYAPCSVRYRLGGANVRVTVDSHYPASGSVRIALRLSQSAAFPISLRIPLWAKGASAAVGGDILPAQEGTMLTLNRQWQDGDEILLTLPMAVRLLPSYHQNVVVSRGPLRFAYAPDSETGVSEEGYPLLAAKGVFGVALCKDAPVEAEVSGDDVTLRAQGVMLPMWGMRGPSCDQPPIALGTGESHEIRLIPYAKSAIRVSVMPIV